MNFIEKFYPAVVFIGIILIATPSVLMSITRMREKTGKISRETAEKWSTYLYKWILISRYYMVIVLSVTIAYMLSRI